MTAGPGPRLTAVLELLRPIAQEIIVAVDDRADDETVRAAASVADRVVRYPFAEPVDRPLPWLFHECTSDWMLTVDDDEAPSLDLLDRLPALCADERIAHYSIARRWVFPDSRTYLDDSPWAPDYQLRLLRTDARVIRFSDTLHRPVIADGPGAFVDEPLWHLDPVLRTREERLAKAHRYEQQRPGMRIGSLAFNYAFYVPELRPDARLAPLSTPERTLVDSVLAAETRPHPRAVDVEQVTREEIDAHWPAVTARQRGELELLRAPSPFAVGEERAETLGVRNTGTRTWQWGQQALPAVRCASWWDDEDRTTAIWTPLPGPVDPGEGVVAPVHVRAPWSAGSHTLHFDLVHEGIGWFDIDVTCSVEVLARKRTALIGADEHELAAAAATAPGTEPVLLKRAPRLDGEGHREAPGLWGRLLDESPRNRFAFAIVLAWRIALVVARPSRADLGDADALVVTGARPEERRERLVERTTMLVARRLGMRVTGRR